MQRKYDVAGLGNAIIDVIAAVDDDFLLRHAIAKGAMTLIDEFRAQELHKALGKSLQEAGGSAANTMAGLASLGARAVFLGKVRDDAMGARFGESLKSLGVNFTSVPASGGSPTASSMIAVTPDGQRSMNTYLGACREMTPDDVDEREIAEAKVLYIEGYLWDADAAKEASRKAIVAAKNANVKVALSLSDSFCVGRFRDEFLELMRRELDILFANEDEAKSLFETEDFSMVKEKLRSWGGLAAITRSAQGCVVIKGAEQHTVSAYPVAKVVDTTGAGDLFAAGFLYGVTHGKDLTDCGRLGGLAAAEVISHYGARPESSLKELATSAGLI
ncbi:MAG TPA: adenosine kinase [Rhizomicrobium sp.]|nr:adenosine kinase [Rhizomicrobium sp.]